MNVSEGGGNKNIMSVTQPLKPNGWLVSTTFLNYKEAFDFRKFFTTTIQGGGGGVY